MKKDYFVFYLCACHSYNSMLELSHLSDGEYEHSLLCRIESFTKKYSSSTWCVTIGVRAIKIL